MFKPPFGLYCPLFRSSSYPAPMTPESRTDFSSNQSKNPSFGPAVSRASRGRVIRQSRVRVRLRLPLGLFPRPNLAIDRSRPSIDPPRGRAIDRSPRRRPFTDRRVARASSRPIDRARAPIARVARARRSRVARAARAPRGLDRGRGRDGFRIKPRARCAPCPRRPSSPRRASSRTCSRRSRRRAWS